jgi:hypothetical protein
MQSKTGQAEIQNGGGRHLENQLYVITTVLMVRLRSNFYHGTVQSSGVRKSNRKRDKRKYKMAAASILKIIYTSKLPYLWSDFAQIFTIAPSQLAVYENEIEGVKSENRRWRRKQS